MSLIAPFSAFFWIWRFPGDGRKLYPLSGLDPAMQAHWPHDPSQESVSLPTAHPKAWAHQPVLTRRDGQQWEKAKGSGGLNIPRTYRGQRVSSFSLFSFFLFRDPRWQEKQRILQKLWRLASRIQGLFRSLL